VIKKDDKLLKYNSEMKSVISDYIR